MPSKNVPTKADSQNVTEWIKSWLPSADIYADSEQSAIAFLIVANDLTMIFSYNDLHILRDVL